MVFHEKWDSPAHNATSCTCGFPWDSPAILWYEAFKGHDLITIVSAASRTFLSATVFLPSPCPPLWARNRGHHWLGWCSRAAVGCFCTIIANINMWKDKWCLRSFDLTEPLKVSKGPTCREFTGCTWRTAEQSYSGKKMDFEVRARWQRVSVFVCRKRPTHL